MLFVKRNVWSNMLQFHFSHFLFQLNLLTNKHMRNEGYMISKCTKYVVYVTNRLTRTFGNYANKKVTVFYTLKSKARDNMKTVIAKKCIK